MPCSYIKKQLRRNSLQLQSFDAFCRLNGLRRQHKGNKVIFALLSNFLGAQLTNSMLLFNFSFLDTAHRGGQNNSENYHLRGTEPFHRRDTFNINTLFLPHVSNVPEY